MKNRNILLLLIIALFLATRLYQLTSNPPALYWDEASIGVNAYSVIQTGKDEWGKFLPVNFRAFGEFKLPVFVYTVAFFEKFLGLNEWAVRLPAVLFSLGTVILTYLLGEKFSKNKSTGVLSALTLTTLPWFFILSRVGYEATAGLMFYLLGIWLFLQISKSKLFLLLSVISLVVSSYCYNSFRVMVPITLVVLVIYFFKSMQIKWRSLSFIAAASLIIYVLSLVPIVRQFTTPNQTSRFNTVSIFASGDVPQRIVMDFTKNYLSHYSPDFLLLSGDKNLRSQQSGFGQIFWLELPFILLGIFYVFKNRNPLGYLFLLLLLFSPIPAAITKESPHALRSISIVPFMAILTAQGVRFAADYFHSKRIIYLLFSIGIGIFFSLYWYRFSTVYPWQSSQYWQYGYKELFLNYGNKFNQFDHVIISDYLAQPYIFALFYLKTDPMSFISQHTYNSVDKWGFSTVSSFGNLMFVPISKQQFPLGKLLVFTSSEERLTDMVEKGLLRNIDGSIAFYIFEYENK
ncbi:MAG: glycosyltransferase family 39 protein [Candidatus Daviesbacteria bacterium]|nr:glycosyltransferase family 39 protein [Candidatus Daviesbacteria bacterium]